MFSVALAEEIFYNFARALSASLARNKKYSFGESFSVEAFTDRDEVGWAFS